MKNSDIKRDDMGMVYLGAALTAVGALYVWWSMSHTEITYYGLKAVWYLLGIFDYSFMPAFIGRWRYEAIQLALNAPLVSFDNLLATMNKAGYLFVWIPVALAARGIRRSLQHPDSKTRRKISVETLPWIMSVHSPAVIPALYYGDLLNTDPEEHRSSMNPEEWVALHSLLVNGSLVRDRCREILIADLGQPITSLTMLAPHEKALFAIFGARLLSDGKDIKHAQALLDQLNRSCHRGRWRGKPGYPDLTICQEAFAKYADHPDALRWLEKHSYPRSMLYAMHKASLSTGKLPSSHFRWLKGMDRQLWYALNTTGRKGPFIESCAVFTQSMWESFAFENGYCLDGPCIDGAIDGIEAYLIKIGLLAAPLRGADAK